MNTLIKLKIKKTQTIYRIKILKIVLHSKSLIFTKSKPNKLFSTTTILKITQYIKFPNRKIIIPNLLRPKLKSFIMEQKNLYSLNFYWNKMITIF